MIEEDDEVEGLDDELTVKTTKDELKEETKIENDVSPCSGFVAFAASKRCYLLPPPPPPPREPAIAVAVATRQPERSVFLRSAGKLVRGLCLSHRLIGWWMRRVKPSATTSQHCCVTRVIRCEYS